MTKVTIDRELLEIAWRYMPSADCADLDPDHAEAIAVWHFAVSAILAAPRQTASDPHKHEAQPEVAQNTGSRSMTNKLSSQGRTGCTGVEGVAAPCETPDAVDIFAWATFDGEGSHDLRLYEDNENYRDDFRAANPALHPDWVFPLCRLSDAQRAIAELRDGLDVMTQCADNHSRMFEESAEELDAAREILAQQGRRNTELRAERDTLRQQLAERDAQIASMRAEVTPFIETHWVPVARQRDKLADLLDEVKSDLSAAMNWGDLDRIAARIDAALAEIDHDNE